MLLMLSRSISADEQSFILEGEDTAQVPGAKEEWGVAGRGEMGAVTEQESEAQMQAGSSAPPSASTPGLAQPAPTHDVSPLSVDPFLRQCWLSTSQFLPGQK